MRTIKAFARWAVVVGVIVGATYFFIWNQAQWEVINASTSTSTPTRLQQTQDLVDSLQKQRMADETFIKETEKQIEELKKMREAQARLDALMIVRTQLEVEIANLEADEN